MGWKHWDIGLQFTWYSGLPFTCEILRWRLIYTVLHVFHVIMLYDHVPAGEYLKQFCTCRTAESSLPLTRFYTCISKCSTIAFVFCIQCVTIVIVLHAFSAADPSTYSNGSDIHVSFMAKHCVQSQFSCSQKKIFILWLVKKLNSCWQALSNSHIFAALKLLQVLGMRLLRIPQSIWQE